MGMTEDQIKAWFDASLDSCIKINYAELPEYVNTIGNYNDFNPEEVLKMMDEIDKNIPRMWFSNPNPNTGGRIYDIHIGREGSPVIYLKFTNLIGCENIKEKYLFKVFNKTMVEDLKGMAEFDGQCDEFDYDYNMEYSHGHYIETVTIRMWWD
jgi:hypothetical protein